MSAGNGGETTRERMENRSSTEEFTIRGKEDFNAMEGLEDDIFGEPGKSRKSRSQRRKEKLQWKKEQEVSVRDDDLPASHDEITRMQLEDETLDKIRKYIKGEIPTPPGVQFTDKNGLYIEFVVLDRSLRMKIRTNLFCQSLVGKKC